MEEQIPQGYLRVSEILSPYCDYDGIPADILERACQRGTLVHKCCELYMQQEYVPPLLEHQGYFDSFKLWYDDVESTLRNKLIEKRMNHDLLRLSGMCDLAARFGEDETYTIFDIKTPASQKKSWRPQLSAYRYLFENVAGLPCNRRLVIHLQKDGKRARIIEYTDHDLDWQIFKNCLENYKFFNS